VIGGFDFWGRKDDAAACLRAMVAGDVEKKEDVSPVGASVGGGAAPLQEMQPKTPMARC